jgi:cytochrome c551/c552
MQKKSRLKPLSKRRALEKRGYAQAWREQDEQLMESVGQINCVSCGCTLVGPSGQGVSLGWAHSHNLSVKHFKHLETDPENFKPRCMKCHVMLDDTRDFEIISQFKDFSQLMEYRKLNSIHSYNQWVSCLLAIGVSEYQYIQE